MNEPQTHLDPDSGKRYLDPITYKPFHMFTGKRVGWTIPEPERETWDKPTPKVPPPIKPAEQPKPIQDLITELEAWVDITPPLETQLRNCYHLNPLRTSRAGQAVINGAEARRLTNPAGLLVKRLRDITNTNPPDFA